MRCTSPGFFWSIRRRCQASQAMAWFWKVSERRGEVHALRDAALERGEGLALGEGGMEAEPSRTHEPAADREPHEAVGGHPVLVERVGDVAHHRGPVVDLAVRGAGARAVGVHVDAEILAAALLAHALGLAAGVEHLAHHAAVVALQDGELGVGRGVGHGRVLRLSGPWGVGSWGSVAVRRRAWSTAATRAPQRGNAAGCRPAAARRRPTPPSRPPASSSAAASRRRTRSR